MLKDLFAQNPDYFKVLSKKNLMWLKKIQNDINNNTFSLFSGTLNLSENPYENREKTERKHSQLCLGLIKNKEIFEPFTGKISSINIEHPTVYGPIDIFILSNETAYIIEVKTTSATHAIIGQVMKYWIAVSLKTNLKMFDEVKIITLCPSYDENAYKGLKSIQALPLILNDNPLRIKKAD